VETEFSRVRFGGDEQREAAVYERVAVTARAQVAGSGQQFHRQ
jgi:hypothetical protein